MAKKRFFLFGVAVSLIILMVALGGCSSSSGPTPSPTSTSPSSVSFKSNVQPIFNTRCVVCHQGGAPPASLSLEPSLAYLNLVDTPSTQGPLVRVAPGAPENSYLINKLRGTQAQAGGSGAQMPYGTTPLPDSDIDLIQQWITAGAPDN